MTENDIMNLSNLEEALPVFRYKFMPETINELNKFAKVHRYDTRDDFKLAWEDWLDYNDDMVIEEKNRLNRLGYEGNVEDKMYKSVRYYYRKKPLSKQEPSKRRKYCSVGKELLHAMDVHIHENHKNKNFTPAIGFDEFCKEYYELLKDHINEMASLGTINAKSISEKVKKTYKNRYFRVSRNMTTLTSDDE